MVAPAVIASIVGGGAQIFGAKSAADAQKDASKRAVRFQEQALGLANQKTQRAVDVGRESVNRLGSLTSEAGARRTGDPAFTGTSVAPAEVLPFSPLSQDIAELNPILDFLRTEGFTDIQESAAASGRLGAGGTLKDLTRFNNQLASTLVPQLQAQRFNRELGINQFNQNSQNQLFNQEQAARGNRFNELFNTATMGTNAAVGQGTNTLNTANQVANQLGIQGLAGANQAINTTNAITGGIQDFATAFPSLFGGQTRPPPSVAGSAPGTFQGNFGLNSGAAVNALGII